MIPLPEKVTSVIKFYNNSYMNVLYQSGQYQVSIDKSLYYLDQKLVSSWLSKISEIEELPLNGQFDLSKASTHSKFEFIAQNESLAIEVFAIENKYFMKTHYRNIKENKEKRSISRLSQKNYEVISRPLLTLTVSGLSLPVEYKKITYNKNGQSILLDKKLAAKTYECLQSFKTRKVLYHGNIKPQDVSQYSIGKKINANISGYIEVHVGDKKLPIHFGKAVENPINVRVWPRHQQQILEGDLPCFSTIRSLDSL